MTDSLVLPAYGRGSVAEVLTSVAAHLGVPDFAEDTLGLPSADRYVVLLVDGLGWNLLLSRARVAPYLASLADRPITAGVPATTATSLTSLGTGLVPGAHGIAGFRFRLPETGVVFSPLSWDCPVPAAEVQPEPSVLERLVEAGLHASAVEPARFEGSGLTEASMRGATFFGVATEDDLDERCALIGGAVAQGKGVVYAYERELDHTAHGLGMAHPAFDSQLARIDGFCERLRGELPDDVRLIVTGDHGMIDVPHRHRLVIEDVPDLAAGVDLVGGEGRFRHLYTAEPLAVAARWAAFLGGRAWVRTREEAIADGWFGPMSARNAGRFGDVVAAMRGDWALLTRTLRQEWRLVGMHASLTPAEMLVPLLVD